MPGFINGSTSISHMHACKRMLLVQQNEARKLNNLIPQIMLSLSTFNDNSHKKVINKNKCILKNHFRESLQINAIAFITKMRNWMQYRYDTRRVINFKSIRWENSVVEKLSSYEFKASLFIDKSLKNKNQFIKGKKRMNNNNIKKEYRKSS